MSSDTKSDLGIIEDNTIERSHCIDEETETERERERESETGPRTQS